MRNNEILTATVAPEVLKPSREKELETYNNFAFGMAEDLIIPFAEEKEVISTPWVVTDDNVLDKRIITVGRLWVLPEEQEAHSEKMILGKYPGLAEEISHTGQLPFEEQNLRIYNNTHTYTYNPEELNSYLNRKLLKRFAQWAILGESVLGRIAQLDRFKNDLQSVEAGLVEADRLTPTVKVI